MLATLIIGEIDQEMDKEAEEPRGYWTSFA
jgi:hypothetical protein